MPRKKNLHSGRALQSGRFFGGRKHGVRVFQLLFSWLPAMHKHYSQINWSRHADGTFVHHDYDQSGIPVFYRLQSGDHYGYVNGGKR